MTPSVPFPLPAGLREARDRVVTRRNGNGGVRRSGIVMLATLAVALAWGPRAVAQEFVTVRGKQPIPRGGFQSWSLVLVTNQDWLIPSNANRLQDLYDRSLAFGRVIGGDHAAVWFWKETQPLDSPTLAGNVDVERAIAYCRLLKLKPSDGPYLVFTAAYPDEEVVPEALHVFSLAGKSADEIGQLLSTLADQLVTEGVLRGGQFQHEPGSDDFWGAWFDATRHALKRLGMNVRFLIRTPSFTIESGVNPGTGG